MERAKEIFVSEYALSRRSYYADFFTMPAATSIAVLWLLTLHVFDPAVFVSAVFAGMVSWSFIEYGVHRWAFHGLQNKDHRAHHMFPVEFIGVSPVLTAALGAFAFWILTLVFGPLVGVGLLVGLVSGYLFYIFVHDRMHHGESKRGSYISRLTLDHDYHHKRFRVNFGVTSPLWDYLLGTYQRNPE